MRLFIAVDGTELQLEGEVVGWSIAVAIAIGIIESGQLSSPPSTIDLAAQIGWVGVVPEVPIFADAGLRIEVGSSGKVVVAANPQTLQGRGTPVGPILASTLTDGQFLIGGESSHSRAVDLAFLVDGLPDELVVTGARSGLAFCIRGCWSSIRVRVHSAVKKGAAHSR